MQYKLGHSKYFVTAFIVSIYLNNGSFYLIIFNVWNHFVWLRITDEGSLPEMRIWSILLIKSDLNGVYIKVEVSFHINADILSCIYIPEVQQNSDM